MPSGRDGLRTERVDHLKAPAAPCWVAKSRTRTVMTARNMIVIFDVTAPAHFQTRAISTNLDGVLSIRQDSWEARAAAESADRREVVADAVRAGDGDIALALAEGAGAHRLQLVRALRVVSQWARVESAADGSDQVASRAAIRPAGACCFITLAKAMPRTSGNRMRGPCDVSRRIGVRRPCSVA